jgi:hypothetical protein
MEYKLLVVISTLTLLCITFSGCLGDDSSEKNILPTIIIEYPQDNQIVSHLVMISGSAHDENNNEDLLWTEVSINENQWQKADGTSKWSYDWPTYELTDGSYTLQARTWDGTTYSNIYTITVQVDNPEKVPSNSPKYALFIAAANFPESNDTKLGNGGLHFAEEMAAYLIQHAGYSTENIVILFDDGWIREDNGYGDRILTLQQRTHTYDIIYGGATKTNVQESLNRLVNNANQHQNSEVFLWIFNHGYGDATNTLTGGKLFKQSQIFLWDALLSDKTLGTILFPLQSQKTTIIIDACYAGGFADKTIFNIPTSLLLRSGLPQSGRIIITGASKFRKGYASTTYGPLFSILWYEGLSTGKADGFRSGLLNLGRPAQLKVFKDGKTSVEEAFYYARYVLRTNSDLQDFRSTQPQINDKYPNQGLLRSSHELFLTEN